MRSNNRGGGCAIEEANEDMAEVAAKLVVTSVLWNNYIDIFL